MKKLCYLLALLLLLTGCELFGPEEEPHARISVEGVDGVRFGDTPEEVVKKLGPYDGWGFSDGTHRSWQTYFYHKGSHAGLKVRFLEMDDPERRVKVIGVVDMFSMERPYDGTTAKKIGIGSTKEEVVRAYGEPIAVQGYSHYYCLGEKDIGFVIVADTVHVVSLGFFKPLEEQHCN